MPSSKQFGCEKCFQAEAEEMAKLELAHVARLVDQSHLGISILACPACGQRCVWIFTESIDWVGGDDPSYVSVLPVTLDESEMMLSAGAAAYSQIEALGHRQYLHLQNDYAAGGLQRVRWVYGDFVIGPHD